MGCFHAGVILFPRTIPSGELGIRPQSGLSFGIDVFYPSIVHCQLYPLVIALFPRVPFSEHD